MEEEGKLIFYPPQEMQGICIADNCRCENTSVFEIPCQYRPRAKDIVRGSKTYDTIIIFSLCGKHRDINEKTTTDWCLGLVVCY